MSRTYRRYWYYNIDTETFECLWAPTRAKRHTKILITPQRLRKHLIAQVGPDDYSFPGAYLSEINGIEFYWDDLNKTVECPENDYRVYHPNTFSTCIYMDERGW